VRTCKLMHAHTIQGMGAVEKLYRMELTGVGSMHRLGRIRCSGPLTLCTLADSAVLCLHAGLCFEALAFYGNVMPPARTVTAAADPWLSAIRPGWVLQSCFLGSGYSLLAVDANQLLTWSRCSSLMSSVETWSCGHVAMAVLTEGALTAARRLSIQRKPCTKPRVPTWSYLAGYP
jgi:hypothetical protein